MPPFNRKGHTAEKQYRQRRAEARKARSRSESVRRRMPTTTHTRTRACTMAALRHVAHARLCLILFPLCAWVVGGAALDGFGRCAGRCGGA
jgi:hypothetical protein